MSTTRNQRQRAPRRRNDGADSVIADIIMRYRKAKSLVQVPTHANITECNKLLNMDATPEEAIVRATITALEQRKMLNVDSAPVTLYCKNDVVNRSFALDGLPPRMIHKDHHTGNRVVGKESINAIRQKGPGTSRMRNLDPDEYAKIAMQLGKSATDTDFPLLPGRYVTVRTNLPDAIPDVTIPPTPTSEMSTPAPKTTPEDTNSPVQLQRNGSSSTAGGKITPYQIDIQNMGSWGSSSSDDDQPSL